MTDRPTLDAPSTFEARLTSAFAAYADRAPMDVDATTLTALVAAGSGRRNPLTGTPRFLVPILLGLLLVALAAGVALVGGGLLDRRPDADTPQQPAVVAPSADPSAEVTAAPVSEPYVEPTKQPSPSERPPADQPCAAMIQLLQRYAFEDPSNPIPQVGIPTVGPVTGNGDVLFTKQPGAEGGIGRLDPLRSPPAPVINDEAENPFDSAYSLLIDPQSRLVASPDGRAVAIETGDFGQAGCGDPIVVPAGNGFRRPFPGRAFELVSDLAWAPDGSALYGIRRPTLDALGQPYTAELARGTQVGPGTVLRWDAETAEVTELPPGCEDCSRLFVSPDGTHIAAESAGTIKVYSKAGDWRDLTVGDGLLGWASNTSVVLNGSGSLVALDGTVLTRWGQPCCHGTGFDGPLSPDGTTIAGVTLDSDFIRHSVTLLDVRDGSTRIIWGAPALTDCRGMRSGTKACQPGPDPTPDPIDAISGYARIVAWAPDGSAVLLLDQQPDSTSATLRVVPIDGSGAGPKATVEVPDLTGTLGFPNIGPSVAWLPATAP